jgi:serine/threonine-protein kinase
MAYEALTGVKPFAGDSAGSVAHSISSAPVRSIQSFRPDIPPRLAGVVEQAMALRPEDRFPSAAALAQALEHSVVVARVDDTTVAAAAVPIPERTGVMPVLPQIDRGQRKPRRRGAVVPALTAIVVVALLLAGFALTRQEPSPSADRQPDVQANPPQTLPAPLVGPFEKLQNAVDP